MASPAELVADQPRWIERLPSILDFIGDDVEVAHNAGFDTGVIRCACDADGVVWALADALAVTDVIRGLCGLKGTADLETLATALGARSASGRRISELLIGARRPGSGRNSTCRRATGKPSLSRFCHDLYGRVVVFTGTLRSMSRKSGKAGCA